MTFWNFIGIVIILVIIGDYCIDALRICKEDDDE